MRYSNAARHLLEFSDDKLTLSIIEVPPGLWKVAKGLNQRSEEIVQADAQRALLSRATALTKRGLLSLGEPLRGQQIPPSSKQIIQVSIKREQLQLAILAAPLQGGPAVTPGQGDDVIYHVDSGEIFHCQRHFDHELTVAERLCEQLNIEPAQGHRWSMPLDDESIDLIAHLRTVISEQLEVQWDSGQAPSFATARAEHLNVKLAKNTRDWFGLEGAIATSGGHIPLSQLLTAARENRRWISVEGAGWVELEEDLRRGLTLLSRASAGIDNSVSPFTAPTLLEAEAEGISIEGPERWLQLTERINHAAKLQPEVPKSLRASLRPYQRQGFVWMAQLAEWATGACLADDMGLGKTVQAIALLLRRAKMGPALVIAPTSVGFNWLAECERFAPSLQLRTVRSQRDLDLINDSDSGVVLITSYDIMTRHISRWSEISWATLVFDETQALKNASTKRHRAAIQLKAEFTLALTGTPLENHTGEIWSLFHIIVPELLGPRRQFQTRYQVPIERHGCQATRHTLATRISPFILRRLKSAVAHDLPPRTDVRLNVILSDGEQRLYTELQRAVAAELSGRRSSTSGGDIRMQLLAAITRLRQIACHPRLFDPTTTVKSSKLAILRAKIDDLRREGQQALVFSQFTTLLALTRDALERDGVTCVTLDGSMPVGARQKSIDTFQNGDADVFLLSIKAGGVGLNLTAASFVFLLDPWWNPAVEDQATDRAHRIGQIQPVTVYRLVAKDTIEESIYKLHNEKRALLDAVLAGAGSSRALSINDLHQLLSPSTDAQMPV